MDALTHQTLQRKSKEETGRETGEQRNGRIRKIRQLWQGERGRRLYHQLMWHIHLHCEGGLLVWSVVWMQESRAHLKHMAQLCLSVFALIPVNSSWLEMNLSQASHRGSSTRHVYAARQGPVVLSLV